MTENIQLAFQLLIVGMSSVFLILSIVVGLGRILIFSVNKFDLPKESTIQAVRSINIISSKDIAILSSVVDSMTDGKGVIKSIKKNS